MCSGIDPQSNIATLTEAISSAARGGAKMVFTPEMSGLLDRDRKRSRACLTNMDNDVCLKAVAEHARKEGIWVALGSLALAGERKDGRLVNRSIVVDPSGQVRAWYDKLHLFDVDLASGESWRESAAYAPGEGCVAVETPVGILGLSICYDIRFPALYQSLSNAGANVLAVPAAFTESTGKAHWHTLLRARAIENAAWIVAAAQSGKHEDGRTTFGHSLVVDPWGEIALDMGDQSGLAFAEIDASRVTEARARVPVIAHRRQIPGARVIQ